MFGGDRVTMYAQERAFLCDMRGFCGKKRQLAIGQRRLREGGMQKILIFKMHY